MPLVFAPARSFWTAGPLALSAALLLALTSLPAVAVPAEEAHLEGASSVESLFDALVVLPEKADPDRRPLVSISSRDPRWILEKASGRRIENASRIWGEVLALPPEEREDRIKTLLVHDRDAGRRVTLYWPLLRLSPEAADPPEAAARAHLLQVWLAWTHAANRTDATGLAAAHSLAFLHGRLAESRLLPVARNWLALPEGDHENPGRALLHEVHARLSTALNDPEAALASWREATERRTAMGQDRLAAEASWGAGQALLAAEHYLEALEVAETSLATFQALDLATAEGARWQGRSYRLEADIHHAMGNEKPALAAYRNARFLFEETESAQDLGEVWLALARVHLGTARWNDAAHAAEMASTALQEAGDPLTRSHARIVQAQALAGQGDAPAADRTARQALASLQVWRRAGRPVRGERFAPEDLEAIFDISIPYLARQPAQEALALAMMERAHTPALFDLLGQGFEAHPEPGAFETLRVLRRHWTRRRIELEQARSAARDPRETSRLQTRLHIANQTLEANLAQFLLASPSPLIRPGDTLKAPAIRDVADRHGPLLYLYPADEGVVATLVPPRPAPLHIEVIDLPRPTLEDRVGAFYDALREPELSDHAAHRGALLYQALFAPFAPHLQAWDRLTVIPHGSLDGLPFASLWMPTDQPLGERWSVSYAPSATALSHVAERARGRSGEGGFLVVAPSDGLNLGDDEAAELMTRAVAQHRPAAGDGYTFRLLPDPTLDDQADLLPLARHLLVGARGGHPPGEGPLGPHLEISPQADHTGHLRSAEILAQELPHTQRVVLAGAALPAPTTLDSLGMARALLAAGASTVVAPRWSVADSPATHAFLLDLHRILLPEDPGDAPPSTRAALAEARALARERGDPPAFWAAWCAVGLGE